MNLSRTPIPLREAEGVAMEQVNIVHIPARSGSQRIKDKNIIDVCGLPLMAYTILLAKKLKGIDHVIVNTDSERYAAIAREFGAETPFIRPREMASDTACLSGPYYLVLDHLKQQGLEVNKMIEMYVTSPFRNLDVIQGFVNDLDRRAGLGCYYQMGIDVSDLCHYDTKSGCSRICLQPGGVPDSLVKPLGLFQGSSKSKEAGDKMVLVKNPIELIDIDTGDDVQLMKDVISNDLYDFGMSL